MKILNKAVLTPLLVATVMFNVGCTADQVEAVQPLVDTFNESFDDPTGNEIDAPEEVLELPTGTAELEPTGIIVEVAVGEIQGVFLPNLPPEATGNLALEPLVIDAQPVQFISGGSTQVPLQSNNPFVTVFVAADSEGYFQIDLPAAVTTADLIITFSTIQLEGELADIGIQVGSAVGDISGAQQLSVSSLVVGTGDLQVSVSWNTRADVDLYLQEPNGELIYFVNSSSEAGGVLDLDSNVGCPENGPQNENITYENVVPPAGQYLVSLDLFSTCSVVTSPTDYVVTVRIGDDVQTFTGALQPDGSSRDVAITSFEIR